MVVLDTQVWVLWASQTGRLSERHQQIISQSEPDGIAASAFSVWEVAMLVAHGRLNLGEPLAAWFGRVLSIPTLHLLQATPQILLDSTRLPGEFHKDPADRIIVSTAISHSLPLLTTDRKILDYPHVQGIGPQ